MKSNKQVLIELWDEHTYWRDKNASSLESWALELYFDKVEEVLSHCDSAKLPLNRLDLRRELRGEER
jgi:hypothetical protein